MLRQVFVALIFFVTASVALAESQQPTPSRPEISQSEQATPADADKSATTKPSSAAPQPIIVNVSPPQKTEVETDEERRDRNEKATLDRRLVDLTAELSAYTFGLFIATALLVVATIGLVVVAVVQFFEARSLFSRDRRPLIALSAPEIRIDDGDALIFRVSAKNTGKNLARNVAVQIKIDHTLPLGSNRASIDFARSIQESNVRSDFTNIIYPDGLVQISQMDTARIPPFDKSKSIIRLVFCVTYQADGIATLLKVAGEITFNDIIVGETDEEGWGNAHFYPHNFRVTYAD